MSDVHYGLRPLPLNEYMQAAARLGCDSEPEVCDVCMFCSVIQNENNSNRENNNCPVFSFSFGKKNRKILNLL